MNYQWIHEYSRVVRVKEMLNFTNPKMIYLNAMTYTNDMNQTVPFLINVAFHTKEPTLQGTVAYNFNLDFDANEVQDLLDHIIQNTDVSMIVGCDLKATFKALLDAGINISSDEFKVNNILLADGLTLKRLTTPADNPLDLTWNELIKPYYEKTLDLEYDPNQIDIVMKNYKQRDAALLRSLWRTNTNVEFDLKNIATNISLVDNQRSKVALIEAYRQYNRAIQNLNYRFSTEHKQLFKSHYKNYTAASYELLSECCRRYKEIYSSGDSILIIESRALWGFIMMERNGHKLDLDYLELTNKKIQQTRQQLNHELLTLTNNEVSLDSANKLIFKYLMDSDVSLTLLDAKWDRCRIFRGIMENYPENERLVRISQIFINDGNLKKYEKQVHKLLNNAYLYGRVYPYFELHGAKTGRVSGTLQQIPKNPLVIDGETICNIREAFVVDKDNGFESVVYLDFDQFEMRMLCEVVYYRHGTCDRNMVRAFVPLYYQHYLDNSIFEMDNPDHRPRWNERQPNGDSAWIWKENEPWKPTDLHLLIAVAAFGEQILNEPHEKLKRYRELGKVTNFTLNYGGGFNVLRRNPELNGVSNETIANLVESYKKTFDLTNRTRNQLYNDFNKQSRTTNLFGRYYFVETGSPRQVAYKTLSWKVQGSCADLIKGLIAMVNDFLVNNNYKSVLINQIHDEIVLQIHRDDPKEVLDEILTVINEQLKSKFKIPMVINQQITTTNWKEKQ